jgi:GNAT superfamily N-acetyltransferase
MLKGRFVPEKLRAYLGASDRWFKLLFSGDEPVGYCSYSLAAPDEMKLEQLYLRAAMKGRGLGGRMLRHVEDEARRHGRRTLTLTVNRKNVDSIAVYRKAGFTVREEKVFDIGQGFVMDDYVMAKGL